MEHLLEMRNLSIDLYKGKKTPAVKQVEGIDLTLEKRQNFGVVGESGAARASPVPRLWACSPSRCPSARAAPFAFSARTEASAS